MNTPFKVSLLTLLTGLTLHAATAEQELTQLLTQTKNVNTDAVIIYKDGKVLYQMYAREYSPTKKHLSWSMGKTFSGVLIGQAVEDGLLNYNDHVRKYYPGLKSEGRIIDFLGMGSGVKYLEDYTGIPSNVDVTKMLYTDGPKVGNANYVTSLPARTEAPGQHYYYSSGDTNVLMGVLQKSIGNQKTYNNYPWQKIFNPLGITDVTFEQDIKGTFVGSSYIYMSPPDYLKVGKLFMQKGVWNGKQIIPIDYFNLMNTVNDGVKNNLDAADIDAYSVQVRTNQPIPSRGLPSQFGELPLDSLIFLGHQGQYIVTSPSENLVIVRLGMDKKSLDKHKFFAAVKKLILAKGHSYQTDLLPMNVPNTKRHI
jgi:CubicO group peptidase (beta-lactamase class C family)